MKCRHEGCDCAAGDNGYCGEYCEKHGGEGHTQHACDCGHQDCQGKG